MASAMSSRARLMSVIAATVISLACGTNYVYSAWGPQFAQHLKLSMTQSNLVGTFGNYGMYATGIPLGMMIDKYGPRIGVILGVALFTLGYYPLAKAFDAGPGAFSVSVLCIFSFFTGTASNSAFIAAVKVAALNYPEKRGTATAFPMAAFGLSALFFSTLALALPHDTPHFLLLLATGTIVLPIVSFPFIRIAAPSHNYKSVSQQDTHVLHRRRSSAVQHEINQPDTGAHTTVPITTPKNMSARNVPAEDDDGDDTSSLLSDTSSTHVADVEIAKSMESDRRAETPRADIRGFALMKHSEFWQLFTLLGLLSGIGLMTINNIGNNASALWKHFDASNSGAFIAKRQVLHVSVISLCSCFGRLLSGIGSDMLVNRYNESRLWCVFASASGMLLAQMLALVITNPVLLVLVSGVLGVSYGMLFGVYPSILTHAFGVHGFSQNWGTICLAPVVSGNVFNLFYGAIYDSHSIVEDNGDRECIEGKSCYQAAYLLTLCAAVASIVLCLYSIRHENRARQVSDEKARRRPDPNHLS